MAPAFGKRLMSAFFRLSGSDIAFVFAISMSCVVWPVGMSSIREWLGALVVYCCSCGITCAAN